jgi:flavin reductase (DIM6/NTAB) family NADH-FMN oxidoreductase RutF
VREAAFADAMARLVSGVCVVTARGRDGEPTGLLATSICSYSVDPPAVLVCVGRRGRARDAIVAERAFGVHLLRAGQQDLARRFALPGADRFAGVSWEWDAGVPALAPELLVAYVRCVRVAVKHHGDHAMVIGEVEHVESAASEPLVYQDRRMDWRVQPVAEI